MASRMRTFGYVCGVGLLLATLPSALFGASEAPEVVIEKVAGTENENKISVTFTLRNDDDVEPGVTYALLLMRASDGERVRVDEVSSDTVITLGKSETYTDTLVYPLDGTRDGTYELVLQVRSKTGYVYTSSVVDTLTLNHTARTPLVIREDSCASLEGAPLRGVLPGGQVEIQCDVRFDGTGALTASPQVSLTRDTEGGRQVQSKVSNTSLLSIKSGEQKKSTIAFEAPKAPGIYTAHIRYGTKSNSILYRFQVGMDAYAINSVSLDQNVYEKGDSAHVTVHADGAKEGGKSVVVNLLDAQGIPCSKPSAAPWISNLTMVSAPIIAACENPRVVVTLGDQVAGILANTQFVVEVKKVSEEGDSVTVYESSGDDGVIVVRLTPSLLLSVLGLTLALLLIAFQATKKKTITMPDTTPVHEEKKAPQKKEGTPKTDTV